MTIQCKAMIHERMGLVAFFGPSQRTNTPINTHWAKTDQMISWNSEQFSGLLTIAHKALEMANENLNSKFSFDFKLISLSINWSYLKHPCIGRKTPPSSYFYHDCPHNYHHQGLHVLTIACTVLSYHHHHHHHHHHLPHDHNHPHHHHGGCMF